MKRFTAPSIDRIVRLRTGAAARLALALALTFSLAACATAPTAPPADAPIPDASAPVDSSVVESSSEVPSASDSRRAPPPSERVVAASLAEPVVSSPRIAATKPALPTDITVLSSEPSLTAAAALAAKAFSLPEPALPKPEAALMPQKPASAAAAPALPAPEAKKAEPAKPAPAAAPKAAAAPPKPAAAPTPKPAAAPAAAEDKKPAETPADTDPKPAVVLPASPASSARSVDPTGGKPVAETRIETVRGERFELRFPGTGWLYLGDEEGKEGLKYETRRFEDTQAVFALNPEAEGEYVLCFQRQNPVDRSTEVSLVRVVVKEKAAASAAAVPAASAPGSAAPAAAVAPTPTAAPTAPAASAAAPAAPVPSPAASAAVPAAAAVAAPPAPALPDDPAAILRLARAELEAKRAQSAIEALDHYLSLYPYGNDELFYLYGLAYEQDTPFRDIKKAWESYKRVRDEYPRSARWSAAADRVAYLERHYFGLR